MNRLQLIKQAANKVQKESKQDPITSYELKKIVDSEYVKTMSDCVDIKSLNFN